jgi:hypothetical protein
MYESKSQMIRQSYKVNGDKNTMGAEKTAISVSATRAISYETSLYRGGARIEEA